MSSETGFQACDLPRIERYLTEKGYKVLTNKEYYELKGYTSMSIRGADLISRERKRQIENEGYSREDDIGRESDLAAAACVYARTASEQLFLPDAYSDDITSGRVLPGHFWPWNEGDFKPAADPMRTLVKAGALIAAAIDALQEAERKAKEPK